MSQSCKSECKVVNTEDKCLDINGNDLEIIFRIVSTLSFVEEPTVIFCVDGVEVVRYTGVVSSYDGVDNARVVFTIKGEDFTYHENREAIGEFRLWSEKGVDATKTLKISKSKV